MNRDLIIDYLACILIKLLGPIIRSLPKDSSLFLGRRLGDLFYYFDLKHKVVAYANLKTAFGTSTSPCFDRLSICPERATCGERSRTKRVEGLSANGECNRTIGNSSSPEQLSWLTKEFYRHFGQNLIELFMIPLVDKEYIKKYISIEGLDYIYQGFKEGRGVILLTVHAGSWELSNIICANLGFAFVLFVGQQRYPRLNKLLNSYRSAKGCKIIQRQNGIRQLVEALKNNEAIGMTLDQGGKNGILVKFLGRDASMASGAIRLALRYNSALIPVFFTWIKGAKFKVIIEPAFNLKRTGDLEKDVCDNLQEITHIFERYIRKYPQEYLWTYKLWKYGKRKNILILSDGKTGHLRQAQTAGKIISDYLEDKGIKTDITTQEVKFKSKLNRLALILSSCLSGKYHCQGCLFCLKTFLNRALYMNLITLKPDVIISCGSSVAPINYILSRENLAKSIVIMRPSILSTKRFDLVIMPRHDKPPGRKNIVVTEGALNLIDEDYLRRDSEELIGALGSGYRVAGFYIGLLIGGDTKNFHLSKKTISEVIKQIKSASQNLNADILVTTSRRTSSELENLIKEEFTNYQPCKLLVIANEKNLTFALGGILGLSQMVVVSCESISMISEAVSSKKYVIVFNGNGLGQRHKRFLEIFAKNKYIYLCEYNRLGYAIENIWQDRPPIHALRDNFLVREAIKRIL